MDEHVMGEHVGPENTRPPGARRGRWARVGRLGAFVALVAGIAIGSATTSVVWANHSFPDVPTSSPHHGDISWAVDNGITQGYNDGTFRPTQAVSRQTMATFLRRLNAEFELVQSAGAVGASNAASHTTTCPPGKRALAGGGSSSSANFFMTYSSPTGPGWEVRWESDNNATLMDGHVVIVYALCAPGL